jgi:hypothetical protein
MTTLMSYLSGFGLATGAGAKAFVPILLLGAFHYTPYFELTDRWRWIANPVVMSVLGVLVLAEILVDSIPELGEHSDLVAYLPKFAAGFIGFAAITGNLDHDLVALSGSGLLGGGTAVAVHWARTKVRSPFRMAVEGLHSSAGRVASVSEAGMSATLAGTAVLVPPASIALAAVGLALMLVVWRAGAGRRPTCPSCDRPTRRGALACPHCGAALSGLAGRV